ncbi:CbiX/SirB N-terminal domain-containing protein [Streptomyces sp. NPDC005435]|uniref:sirohydrochlorin chelatase n=1 Tax=Streptomyces sp. NPDC005435 TaxID=3154464 RepID=UPI003454F876
MSATPTLLAVAHGTRDTEGVRTVHALLDEVRRARPALRVEVAWLGLAEPSVPRALAALPGPAVAVPLLLARGYHVRADLPALLADARPGRVRVAPALGPSPLLARALAARLAEAGRPAGGTPVVLAAAGSSDPRARADTAESARLLAARLNAPVTAAFAAGEGPSPAEAVAAWHTAGHPDVALATHLLAPGHFAHRLTGTEARWTTAPLGAQRWLAALVLRRYDEGAAPWTRTAERTPAALHAVAGPARSPGAPAPGAID